LRGVGGTRLYAAEQVLSDLKQQRDILHSGIRDFPSGTLLIGDNDLGDHYLLSLRPADFGSVYFYFHETANPNEDDNSGIYVLCRTFADWLDSLERKEPDPTVPDWDRIREEERARILAAPRKRWWEFWK
jgi:SMI1 / KNR4 family (SUKH-1)